MQRFYYFIVLFCFLFSNVTEARWATLKDAALRYDLWRSVINVEKDGTYTEEVEFKAKILKDSAIDSFGNFLLTYNEQSQKVTILSAKTVNKGKSFPVDPKFIEDKPLASSFSGFDQTRQILVAFPHVGIGSDIYMRYRHQFKTVPYKNFFSYSKTFAHTWFMKAEVQIQSALPLYYKLHNPQKALKISYRTHKKKKKKYELKLILKQPLFKKILDERYVFTNLNLFPRIEVTSEKNWARMVRHLVPKYKDRIAEPLPKLYQNILKSSKKFKTGSRDQINFILYSLIEKIRYMSDWRHINGGHVPRSLSAIVKTGFGDCKDLSVSLSAILNRLGFKSQVAFIYRGSAYHSSYEYKLPNRNAFNHVIVHSEIKNKIFWLDPTNFLVYSRSVLPDVADRPALILKLPNSQIKRTPKFHSSGSEYRILQAFEIARNHQVKVEGAIHFKGRSAITLTGASLNKSKESIDYQLIQQFTSADPSALKRWEVEDYDLSSRIVKDFSVNVSYIMEKNNYLSGVRTQLGPTFLFPYPYFNVKPFFVRASERVSDLFLGQPRTILFISKLKNIKPVGNLNLNCHLKSRWLNVSRSVESFKPLTIKDKYEFKRVEIPARELKSKDFLKLQENLKNCLHFAMIYKRTD